MYVRLTEQGQLLAPELIEIWSGGRDVYQSLLGKTDDLKQYFTGHLLWSRPLSEWPQAELLEKTFKLLRRLDSTLSKS